MKRIRLLFAYLIILFVPIALFFTVYDIANAGYVRGYFKSSGTYVQPHWRSDPNTTVKDNWDYKGNVNPYTGKEGTKYYRDNPTSDYYNPSYNNKYEYKTPKSFDNDEKPEQYSPKLNIHDNDIKNNNEDSSDD